MSKHAKLLVPNDLMRKNNVMSYLVPVQWEQNEGKCGVCGDAFHVTEPRPHEARGMYGKGIVTRHYSVGQVGKIFFSSLSILC